MATEFTIEWCNVSSYSDSFLVSAFDEFSDQLQTNYPNLPAPEFFRLPFDLVAGLPDYLISMLPGRSHNEEFSSYESKHLFIFCDGDEKFAQIYQDQNLLAHWGVAIPCLFSIAWEPNKYLLWHELLHLMNAKDCYNKFGINKCPNPSCIMRRAPTRTNCGDRLTMCSKNIERLRRFGAELTAKR